MKSEKKALYTPPLVEVVEVKNEGILCDSVPTESLLINSYPDWVEDNI